MSYVLLRAYLTDESYEWHTQQAYRLGYIRSPERARGIARFINMLSVQSYHDTRPPNLRHTHLWCPGIAPARMRLIGIRPDALVRLSKMAQAYQVPLYRSQRPIQAGLRETVPDSALDVPGRQRVSALLEAIGLRYLTADNELPYAPATLYQSARRVRH